MTTAAAGARAGVCAGPPRRRKPGPDPRRRERGVALVIVLWTLALLAVLAGAFSSATRTHASLAFNILERAKAEALADAAISRAIAGVLTPPEDGGLRVDQTPYGWTFDGGDVVFAIGDEGGKIDLNAANAELLDAVLTALGVPSRTSSALANNIVDFRGGDLAEGPNTTNAADYRRAGRPQGPKGAPFERVDELALVLGATPDLVALLSPIVTVYTGTAEPNIELMPPEYRVPLEGVIGESDLNAVATGQNVMPPGRQRSAASLGALRPRSGANAGETDVLVSLRREGTDTRSDLNVYTIHAEARSPGGAIFVREAVVLIQRDAVPAFRFLDIRQGSRKFFVDR